MKGAGTQLMLQLMETPSACVFPFKSVVVVVWVRNPRTPHDSGGDQRVRRQIETGKEQTRR